MRSLRQRLLGIAFLLALALVAGCASSGGAEADGEPVEDGTTPITVENFHSGSEDLQVFIQRDGSSARTNIGAVPAGETETFVFDGETGQYRLIAQRPVSTTTSERITIRHQTNITWTIQGNRITTSRR
ncbi:MAG: hypothetical protein EA352_01365 [Gemmatimonadales bacterium]|nr:MAG: hypothetical protein EA352_01365 [Gemmatimonadales bacterium]